MAFLCGPGIKGLALKQVEHFYGYTEHSNRPLFLQDNLVLSTELRMKIGHYKEVRKLMFQALALCQSKGLTLEMSAF